MSNVPNILPQGWVRVTLEDVCSKITDGTHKTPNYQPTGFRFISIKNIRPYKPINWDAYMKFISPEEHAELYKRCDPEFGDVVFPRIGTLGFAKRIDFHEEVSLFVGLGLLKPIKEVVLPKYLEAYMNTPWIYQLSHEMATGTGRLTLPLAETRRFPILLAPLPEQHRILEAIESYLSRLDAAIAALERVKKNLERYRKSVLKAGVEGRLVPTEAKLARKEGRDYEPADVMLKRILKERHKRWEAAEWEKLIERAKQKAAKERQKKTGRPLKHGEKLSPPEAEYSRYLPKNDKWKQKYKEPAAQGTEGLPELPEGWCWATIEQLASYLPRSIQSGPFGSNLLHSEFQNTGKLVIGIDNVQEGYFSMGSQNRISEEKFLALQKYAARPGDVLVTVMATIGRGCVVPENIEPAIITKHVYRITPERAVILSRYLLFALWGGPFVRSQMFGQVRGQTRPGLNGTIIKGLVIPVPPPAEQIRIIAEVDRLLPIGTNMMAVGDQNMLRVSRLRQSILKWAFDGKLVDQDSNDEPASDLLKRIKTERKAMGKERKKKRENRRGKRMAKRKKQRPLVDVLAEAEGPLSPEDLFSHADFSADSVEVFYDELRREVKGGRVIEERPDERTVKLRMVTS